MKTLLSFSELEKVHQIMNHLNATMLAGSCNNENAELKIKIEQDTTENTLHVLVTIQNVRYDRMRIVASIPMYNTADRICRFAWSLLALYKEDYCKSETETN